MIDRVSSQLTILIRIAIPTVMVATILSLLVLLGFAVQGRPQVFTNPVILIIVIFILGTTVLFIRLILWKIFRIDMDENFIYVSNYFKTFKYPYADVESIRETSLMPGRVYMIRLKSKGSFGQNIYFLASQKLWTDFVSEHPHLFENIIKPPAQR